VTEDQLEEHVRQAAELHSWERYHTRDSRGSPAGWPDDVLCRPPRLLFAELKADRGVVSRAQRDWLDQLDACTQVETYVWRPADIEDIHATLARPGVTVIRQGERMRPTPFDGMDRGQLMAALVAMNADLTAERTRPVVSRESAELMSVPELRKSLAGTAARLSEVAELHHLHT
jgi:hypothetical protein